MTFWRKQTHHFIDVETTSLDVKTGEIISISIISVDMFGRITEYNRLIAPQHLQTADPKSLEINKYDPKLWTGAPAFQRCAFDIFHTLKRGVVVGHNVGFDVAFINKQLSQCGYKKISWYQFDTRLLVMEHLPIDSTSLKSVREFFGWSDENAHCARQDAFDCHRLYFKLIRCTFLHRLWWRLLYRIKKFRGLK